LRPTAAEPLGAGSAPDAVPSEPTEPSRVRWGDLGLPCLIVGFGAALRGGLFATGRAPLDGDEAMMGIMAHHLAAFERLPLYFYRQHYLGTLELPPVAALMAIGPEGWRLSAWPIRIVAMALFFLFGGIHYRLVSRFFGCRAARWSLFFLILGPAYWLQYTSRLRHVVLMMTLGELLALLALGAAEQWKLRRRPSPGRLLLLGLIAGLGWWHYQLIIVFLIPLALLHLLDPVLIQSWLPRPRLLHATCQTLLVASLASLAGLSLGWWANPALGYRTVIGGLMAVAGLAGAVAWQAMRREARAPAPPGGGAWEAPALGPYLVGAGFVLGQLPALVYLATLKEEFWVSPVRPELHDFLRRTLNFLLLEVAGFLEITRPVAADSYVYDVGSMSFVNLVLYGLALYALARPLWARRRSSEASGAAYFLTLLASLIAFHVLISRPTALNEPRFLLPAWVGLAVGLGLAAEAARQAWFRQGAIARLRPIWTGLLAAGAVALWAPGWLRLERVAMSWPEGHRRLSRQMIQAFDDRGLQKLLTPHGTELTLLGYELQFMSGLRLRVNRGTMGDRLEGIVDETQYTGERYFLSRPGSPSLAAQSGRAVSPPLEDLPPGGFWVGPYYFYPETAQPAEPEPILRLPVAPRFTESNGG